jgi:hypothetical protein
MAISRHSRMAQDPVPDKERAFSGRSRRPPSLRSKRHPLQMMQPPKEANKSEGAATCLVVARRAAWREGGPTIVRRRPRGHAA